MSNAEIIEAALAILKARPDTMKGIRHAEAVKWITDVVLPELMQEGGEG